MCWKLLRAAAAAAAVVVCACVQFPGELVHPPEKGNGFSRVSSVVENKNKKAGQVSMYSWGKHETRCGRINPRSGIIAVVHFCLGVQGKRICLRQQAAF